MTDKTEAVEILIEKAAKAESPDSAMKFSQAALNAANAAHTLHRIALEKKHGT